MGNNKPEVESRKGSVGFVKDTQKLEEYNQTDDFFGYSEHAKILSEKLDAISMPASTVAIIGPYGIGKTFLINKVRESFKRRGGFWFIFEAWSYSDRQDLWRAFLNELDDAIIDDSSGCKTIRKLKRAWHEFQRLYKVEAVLLAFLSLALLIAYMLNTLITQINFAQAFLISVPIVVPILNLFVSVIGIFRSNPLHRRETQGLIFKDTIKKLKNKNTKYLFLVLEDIDRSGNHGLVFLETMALFFRRLDKSELGALKVRVLAPISNESFRLPKERNSFLKAVDYQISFDVSSLDTDKFIDSIFRKELVNDELRDRVRSVFTIAFGGGEWEGQINLRTWKAIVKGANDNYIYLKKTGKVKSPSPEICLAVESMKYIRVDIGTPKERSLFDRARWSGQVGEDFAVTLASSKIETGKYVDGRLIIRDPIIELKNSEDFIKQNPSGVDISLESNRDDPKGPVGDRCFVSLAEAYFD